MAREHDANKREHAERLVVLPVARVDALSRRVEAHTLEFRVIRRGEYSDHRLTFGWIARSWYEDRRWLGEACWLSRPRIPRVRAVVLTPRDVHRRSAGSPSTTSAFFTAASPSTLRTSNGTVV